MRDRETSQASSLQHECIVAMQGGIEGEPVLRTQIDYIARRARPYNDEVALRAGCIHVT